MSRSRRKTPIFGITTATSEKYDKRLNNRALRAAVRKRLSHDLECVAPVMREVSDPWCMAKDSKQWIGHLVGANHEWVRK